MGFGVEEIRVNFASYQHQFSTISLKIE